MILLIFLIGAVSRVAIVSQKLGNITLLEPSTDRQQNSATNLRQKHHLIFTR